MRDVLPLLNLAVLLLPIVLLGIELVARSAISVTLPDPSPDVASLDTPPARRSVSGSEDHGEARSLPPLPPEVPRPPRASAGAVFSDSPLGYGP
jgi:hypothetical protein